MATQRFSSEGECVTVDMYG